MEVVLEEMKWPTDERISAIAQNGGDGLHYDEQREQHETQPPAPQANKYDRTIRRFRPVNHFYSPKYQ